MRLGRALHAFVQERYLQAEALFEDVVTRAPDSAAAPEALYRLGINRYKMQGDPEGLIETWIRLLETYPQSEWATRVSLLTEE